MASIVKSLRLLADETRLRLLLLLQEEELSVFELQEILGMGQSRISSHLAQLRGANLVQDRRAGKNIYYAMVAGVSGGELAPILGAAARDLPEAKADGRALEVLKRRRADRSREYFDRMAGKFGRTYVPGKTWEGVSRLLLALVPPIVIADLGAGEGYLAQLLAKRARKVIAVDNSEKMVEYGAGLARENGVMNLEYRLGDLEQPPIEEGSVDLALLSQALHHAGNPLRAVQGAFRIVKSGGRVVVLDLLAHQFEQARELYADTWLGFTEVALVGFMEEAGFREVEVGLVPRSEQDPTFQTVFATGVKH